MVVVLYRHGSAIPLERSEDVAIHPASWVRSSCTPTKNKLHHPRGPWAEVFAEAMLNG